jgi:predicted glutamine amidotransferase
MCRLFFLIGNNDLEQKTTYMKSFLKQSDHTTKNTPGLDNPYEHVTHKDGYGFAWKSSANTDWVIHKSPLLYTRDHWLKTHIQDIAKAPIIIGHIRNRTIGESKIENTHPFVYQRHVFFHNGLIANFETHRVRLLRKIAPKYKYHIKGETDSEVLFYLFLTICDNMNEDNELQKYRKSIEKMFSALKRMKLQFFANIIYSNDKLSVVTRYACFPNMTQLSLYLDISDGILITSEPITPNSIEVEEGSIMVIHIENHLV